MLWFTGSSSEGLPFIHDSFRANPKAVHHRPKQPRQPQTQTHPDKANDNSSDSAATARTLNHRDVSREAMEVDSFRLPAVESVGQAAGVQRSSLAATPRVENGRDPVSFTSYMRRYKACARLKGFSPTRVFCATRMRSTSSENLHHRHHQHDAEHHQSHNASKDPLSTTAIPMSNLRLHPKADHPKADPPPSEAASTELPEIGPRETPTTTIGSKEPSSILEKQVEEKLKRGNSEDDGMKVSGLHNSRPQRRGWGPGRKSGGGSGRGGGGGGCGCGGGSGHVTSRGGAGGGGRPLGDIVSPRRMQELLSHHDDRTLPYTYYRTSVGKEEASLENVDVESKD